MNENEFKNYYQILGIDKSLIDYVIYDKKKDGKYENWVPWQKKMSKNIRKLARNYHARFISVQEPLNREIERLGHDAITTDCIHLTAKGHEILAKIVRDGFGL